MNGPQFVEASRVLSQGLMKQHSDDDQVALIELFRTLTGRQPAENELKILADLHRRQLEYFTKNPAAATAYLKTGERAADAKLDPNRLAALSTVANALFSFDEVVNRR